MGSLLYPNGSHVGSCLERLKPDDQTDDHREKSAEDDSVSMDSEDCATGGRGHGRDGEDEGGEDEDAIDSSSYKTKTL